MPASEPTSSQLVAAQSGDPQALERLWHALQPLALRLAHRRLPAQGIRGVDAEDVAAAAMASLLIRIRDGQLPELVHRRQLYGLLRTIIFRKCCNVARRSLSVRRGGGRVLTASQIQTHPSSDYGPWLEQVPDRGAPPDGSLPQDDQQAVAAILAQLPKELAVIVQMKLQGLSHAQIARRLGCASATVERRLRLVRQRWLRELGQ